MQTGMVLMLVGVSAAGKTTVQKELVERTKWTPIISYTTRQPRDCEVDGVDYHFFSPEDFGRRVAAGEFLEHAEVYGNRYGTLRASVLDVLRSGVDVLLNIDVQGAASIRRAAADDRELAGALVTVFLTPATLAELESRLRGRGSEAEEVVRRRLEAAPVEVGESAYFDYLVVSGTRSEDLARVQAIYEAEQARRSRVHLEFGGAR